MLRTYDYLYDASYNFTQTQFQIREKKKKVESNKNKRTTIPLPLKCLILEKSNHINLFAVKLEPKKKFPSKNELQL